MVDRMYLEIWLICFITSSMATCIRSLPKEMVSNALSPRALFLPNVSNSLTNNTHSPQLFDYPVAERASTIPQCNGEAYGTNLDRMSCFDVWRGMATMDEQVSWGQRGTGQFEFDVKLPYRRSSGRHPTASNRLTFDAIHLSHFTY